jgi:hypothetical protein
MAAAAASMTSSQAAKRAVRIGLDLDDALAFPIDRINERLNGCRPGPLGFAGEEGKLELDRIGLDCAYPTQRYALPPSAYPRRHSHPDCRSPLTLIVARQKIDYCVPSGSLRTI